MKSEYKGSIDGRGLTIGIVVARFNWKITSRLLEGAKGALTANGVTDDHITTSMVPGSFEAPLIAKIMAESGRFNAIICLGAVIRGDTDHYEYIASQAAKGVAEAGFSSGIPVIFGILTTDTIDQAIDRSGGRGAEFVDKGLENRKPGLTDETRPDQGNSGYSAGLVAIEMANLICQIEEG